MVPKSGSRKFDGGAAGSSRETPLTAGVGGRFDRSATSKDRSFLRSAILGVADYPPTGPKRRKTELFDNATREDVDCVDF